MDVYSASKGIISPCAVTGYLCKRLALNYLSAATRRQADRQKTQTELYKESTLLRGTITFTDALPVQERMHDRKQERG